MHIAPVPVRKWLYSDRTGYDAQGSIRLYDSGGRLMERTGPVEYENTFVDARGAKKLEIALKPDLMAAGINEVVGEVEKSIKEGTGTQ